MRARHARTAEGGGARGDKESDGEKKAQATGETDLRHANERRYGSFERTIRIPGNVDEPAISAHFDKGVLTVTLPKKPGSAMSSRRIEIRQDDTPGTPGAA